MDDIKWTNLYRVLNEYADYWIRTAQDIIQQNGNIASGKLNETMGKERKVSFKDDYLSVEINLEPYWKYLDEGTMPHFPPPDAIKKWIEVKPVIPHPDKNGKVPTVDQLSFLIGRKIAREGTEAHPFFYEATEEAWKYFEESVALAIQEDIAEWLNEIIFKDLENIL